MTYSPPTFQRNMLSPSSGSKITSSKRLACLVLILPRSLTMKMAAVHYSKHILDYMALEPRRTSNPAYESTVFIL
jgi:hypothetical protein